MKRSSSILKRVLAASPEARKSLGTRLFLNLRWHFTPYDEMARELPRWGRLLDLGCGYGLLAMELALSERAREVIGVDHDTARISVAAQASQGISNLRFEEGSVLAPPSGPFAGIAIIDTLHYFEPRVQEGILQGVFQALAPGGTLIAREVNPDAGLVSKWNRLYERIATSSGFTRTSRQTAGAEGKPLHFRNPEQWTGLLERLGFTVRVRKCSHPLFADMLYVATKPDNMPRAVPRA